MSKIDKMFEDLGYFLIHCDDGFFYHNPTSDTVIHFNTIKKRISCYDYDNLLVHAIDLDELKAINEKIKELRW